MPAGGEIDVSKNEKRMPDEFVAEGKPASAWGWFLAGFAYLVIVAAIVVPFAFRDDPKWDALVETVKAQSGDYYAFVVMFALGVIFAPFLVALDRATTIAHRYRRERGMTTEWEIQNHERCNQMRTALIAVVLFAIAYVIYSAIAGAK